MDMTFAEKKTVPAKVLAVMLALALAFGSAIGMAFADGATARATPVNEGDPFENGDLVWNGQVQTYRMSGVVLHVDGLTDLGSAPAPYDYPDCLTEANILFVEGKGGGNWPGWGVSDYAYTGLKVDKNTRELKFSALPAKGHCAQSNNQTTYFGARNGYLNLIPNLSYWNDDKTVYHGVFMMAIDNGHEYDVWDQATLGVGYVYADWEVTGGITVQKAIAAEDQDAFAALMGENWKSKLKTTFQLQADDGEGGWKATTKGTAKSGEGSHVKNEGTGKYSSRWNTNAKGKLTIENLPAGKYRLVEYAAPNGCELPRDADGARSAYKTCTVKAGETYTAYYKDADKAKWHNKMATGKIGLLKVSETPSITDGNACYSLAGAEYTIYADEGCTDSTGEKLVTDANGYAAPVEVPTGDYWVRETKAPQGYTLDEEPYPVSVDANKTARVNGYAVTDKPGNDPAQMFVRKLDSATGKPYGQGGASLAGAQFTIRYYDGQYATAAAAEASGAPTRTWVVETDNDGYAHLRDSYKVSGDQLYYNVDGNACVPVGTLLIQETKAPQSYLLPDPNPVEVRNVTMSNDSIPTVGVLNPPVVNEKVKRGDMKLAKFRAIGLERLSGIPFRLTSLDTGESHIVVTDNNGEINTAASWNAHSASTNANDAAVAADGTVDESSLDPSAGVWFAGAADVSLGASVDDALGALPYGTYRLQELKVEKNSPYTMVDVDFEIARDGYTFEVQIPNDLEKLPAISTTARDADSDTKSSYVAHDTKVADRVAYYNLTAGKDYTLKAALMDGRTFEPITHADGTAVTAEKTFTAKASQGSIEIRIPYDARAYKDTRVVVYEELYDGDALIAEHKDIEDFDQTVKNVAPRLKTTALDAADSDHAIGASPAAKVVDVVDVKDVKAGATYTLSGTLNVVDEDGLTAPLLDKDGNAIESTVEFTADDTECSVKVPFTLDTTGLAGKQIVVFETLSLSGVELAIHADGTDVDQTLTVIPPSIGTTAKDGADGDKEIAAAHEVTVVDTVEYTGLVAGETYRVEGTLNIVGEDGGSTPLLDKDGNAIVATREFAPASSAGTVDVAFTFDATALAGSNLVAFETLFLADTEIAKHEDPEDPAQTVTVVPATLGSYASDAADGDKSVDANSTAMVKDTITYSGMAPGEEITLCGLMVDPTYEVPALTFSKEDPARDTKEFGRTLDRKAEFFAAYKAALGLDGASMPHTPDLGAVNMLLAQYQDIAERMVTAKAVHTPKSSDGTAELAYAFDARNLNGEGAVSFVWATNSAGEMIAVHADAADADQTVLFKNPSIRTKAVDATDGDHVIFNSSEASIIDTVTYKDITPGVEYTVKGTLMDKSTGKPVTVNDKPLEAKTTFVAAASAGEVEVTFTFDATKLTDKELVAFEYLYADMDVSGKSEPVLVAQHTDIDNKDQTVAVKGAAPGEPYEKTGVLDDPAARVLAAIGAVALIAAGCALYSRRRTFA